MRKISSASYFLLISVLTAPLYAQQDYATIVNPTAATSVAAGTTLHVSWTGGCAAASYLLTVDRQTASTIQQYVLGPGIQSWNVNLGSDLPQGSTQTVRLLTECGGVQQLPSTPLSTPLGLCEDTVPCAKYTVSGTGSPDSAACNPNNCNPPVWTPQNFVQADTGQPLWFCYNVAGPNDSPGQPDNCLDQNGQPLPALTQPPFTLNLPTCGQQVNGQYQTFFNGLSNDYNNCTTNYNGYTDGSYPGTGLPDAPYFWSGCNQNGVCGTDATNTIRLRGSPEVRSTYVVTKTDPTSLFFRGFEFRGIFNAPPPPQGLADVAVFFSNGINFSGGLEYGFRLTYNKQYPVEFYYSINSNCTCPVGYPCASTVQCKSADSANGPLVAPVGEELPIPAVQLGTEYYFGVWIYMDPVANKLKFKLEILDPNTFASVCAPGTVGYDPIDPVVVLPRDYSWGQVYAKAGPILPTFPNPDTTDMPFATPSSRTGLTVNGFNVAK